MSAIEFAPVNPNVLLRARTEAGWRPEQVAEGVQVKPERVLARDQEERKPTFRQAEHLGRFARRLRGISFLPALPELPPLACEYRRQPDALALNVGKVQDGVQCPVKLRPGDGNQCLAAGRRA